MKLLPSAHGPRRLSVSPHFFTLEDAKTSFNLFCCIYGIGTLGMPANFARAGPTYATVALLFMALANTYASIAVSRVMLVAPATVRTYADLGEWVFHKPGRWAVTISHMGVCLLIPCAFLVLGGVLLQVLFPGSLSQSSWIIVMAITVLPVCLIPTLKEGAGIAFVGCAATVLSDAIASYVLVDGMRSSTIDKSSTSLASLHQVVTTFGNLSLAYGAAIVIPDLQRQHSQPDRMPRIIGVTLVVISVLFFVLATVGYSVAGCRLSGNLLFSITSNDPTSDGASPLGFKASRSAVVAAYVFMQVHITIAFAVLLHPAFYMAERLVLGSTQPHDYVDVEAQGDCTGASDDEHNLDPPRGRMWIPLRCAMVAALVLLALALRDNFLELADFIGASCISVCCLILPLLMYVRVMGDRLPRWERIVALTIACLCFLCGSYVVVSTGRQLLHRSSPSTPFPFCENPNLEIVTRS